MHNAKLVMVPANKVLKKQHVLFDQVEWMHGDRWSASNNLRAHLESIGLKEHDDWKFHQENVMVNGKIRVVMQHDEAVVMLRLGI